MSTFYSIASDALRADISPYGAALARLFLSDHPTSLVLGLPRPEDYANAPDYIGVVVGPIAGRVSGAQTRIHDVAYAMQPNTPPDCLHSGEDGVSGQLWDVVDHADQQITLELTLPDGACGLPGNRTMRTTYAIEGSELSVAIETTSDADTVINAASHAYWTLDGSGNLDAHELTLHADRYLVTDPALIPTGETVPMAGSALDFTAPRNPCAGPPLDTYFCLPETSKAGLSPVMNLRSANSGVALEVLSDQPGVVLYSGESLTPQPVPVNTPPIAPFSALAIEAQGFPDASNRPNFPSVLLKKGTTKTQMTRFKLTVS